MHEMRASGSAGEEAVARPPVVDVFTEKDVTPRLKEEILRANRYRHYLSLVLVDPASTEGSNHLSLEGLGFMTGEQMRGLVRTLDVVFAMNDGRVCAVLPETSENEAACMVKRLRQVMHQHRFAIASYPADGSEENSLLRKAKERLSATLLPSG